MTRNEISSSAAQVCRSAPGLLWLLIFFANASESSAAGTADPLQRSQQCIVVITNSWIDSHGLLFSFERPNSSWRRSGGPIPVLVGRVGLAWGRGEVAVSDLPGPVKHEGDDKAPAGVFRLGSAFGYASNFTDTKMPYLHLSQKIIAVDDPGSRYYNQLVDKTKIGEPDWQTAENMVLADDRYKWGVIVLHNVPPVRGAGSCIFLHVWKDSSTPTSGCTAMAEANLVQLIRWLNPNRAPLLVQMTRRIYNELRARYDLPTL